MSISDARMGELVTRAKNAATRGIGGGDGSPYREVFSDEVFSTTLSGLLANEGRMVPELKSAQCDKNLEIEKIKRQLHNLIDRVEQLKDK